MKTVLTMLLALSFMSPRRFQAAKRRSRNRGSLPDKENTARSSSGQTPFDFIKECQNPTQAAPGSPNRRFSSSCVLSRLGFHLNLCKCEILPGIDIGRVKPHCVAELFCSFLEIAKLNQGHAEVIMRMSVCRVNA